MTDLESSVKAIIVDKLGVNEEEVRPEASFTSDLGADSLDAVELIMEFEKQFAISIPDDKAETLQTVGDVITYIEDCLVGLNDFSDKECTNEDLKGLNKEQRSYLKKDRLCIISTIDGTSYPAMNFNRNGKFHLLHLYKISYDGVDKDELIKYDLTISESEIYISLQLGQDYMEAIQSCATKDSDGFYCPTKSMYENMHDTSWILFYNNPHNLYKSMFEEIMGDIDLDWDDFRYDMRFYPKYKFDHRTYDIYRKLSRKDIPYINETAIKEIIDMSSFICNRLLPELEELPDILKNSMLKKMGKIVGKILLNGAAKGIGIDIKEFLANP